ncbi:endonuclease/exonuclease/phosphatase (EEP) superfamily protein YafD [Humibacillus xanthopallidus]|uniref:Endonuclease/exonuclease/phosphatase (EEP) superfamily protein YafD n=1 Tax=Humibacillus xanthopallidus TaxID=412689 RepID=A0A543PT96_9MICO|nr:endonuclease/exonuclease/phosphatase family protein [Humibacillus xanthopallidus]TQN47308.1 endonuclease/exonuclease/phosphatase (EEP) superfamily protein YafD [Humibacillus xanthopallidus]
MRSEVRRRLADVAILVVLLGLVAVGSLRWVDTTAYPVVVLQTAAPFVAIGLLLLTVVTVVLRRWWVLVPVGVALVVAAAQVVPAFVSHASPDATRDLTVMSANLRVGRAQPTQLMDAVRFHAVDVLVLTEVTPSALEGLSREGADSYFPQRAGEAEVDGYAGTMVLSRYPLREVAADLGGSPNRQPEVAVTIDGVDLRVQTAHPSAPIPGQTTEWRAGLRALQAWKERQTGTAPILLVGDFNSSSAHPGFRAVAAGLDDAQRTTGSGWVRTWPYAGSRLPPFVQLDHVLSRGLTVIDSGQVAMNGTDHAAVWGSYALPNASGAAP